MMRTMVILMAGTLFSAAAMASPDEDAAGVEASATSWTLQLDPLTAALGFAHLQIEYAWTDRFSSYAGPHLRLYDNLLTSESEDYIGLGVEIGLRYFPFAEAPRGLWLSVRGVGARLSTDAGPGPTFGGYWSALVGHTWIFAGRWVLAGGLGAQYIHYRIGDLGTQGFLPALHTAFGVAW